MSIRRGALDALTGGYLRDPGRTALQAGLAAALQAGEPLTLVHVAVEAPAGAQQTAGQIGEDALMVMTANALGDCLRDTDLLVRDGQTHFLCALRGLTVDAAAARMAALHTGTAGSPGLVALSLGYAQAEPQDTAEQLIERASAARRPTPTQPG